MSVKILTGDCLDVLETLENNSVNCCVTSPPYWGLRDYGTAKWEGGDKDCDHSTITSIKETTSSTPAGSNTHGNHAKEGWKGGVCGRCGAVRKDDQLGLEATPEEYVANMVNVFRGVKRVLNDDGTLWLNLGDSYYNYRPGKGQRQGKQSIARQKFSEVEECAKRGNKIEGLKEKDLVGIPWRVAFALQADGWYLRQDIIWHKPNPMPESVTDRCTKAHEYIFLLSKSQKYYCDMQSIKEQSVDIEGSKERYKCEFDGTRNKRSVWTVNTKPYKEAHFAVFPSDLIRPCILAGCPQGGTVLDPFAGSGTTGEVAEIEGRNSILIELNPEYVELAKKRTAQMGLFT